MIYATKERAQEIARMLGKPHAAARTIRGWIVIQRTPYSQGSVLEYA